MCRIFVLVLSFAILICIGYGQRPKLDRWVFRELLQFTNITVQEKLVENLERQNWTLPAVKILDRWMDKYWNNSRLWNESWVSSHWSWKGKEGTRNTIKILLYQFKGKKTYINHLCKTAVEQEILNSANAGKIRKFFWKLDETYYFDGQLKRLFNPELAEYEMLNVTKEGIVDLKAISDKYLEDEKQYSLLRLTYFDI
ncbi:DUF4294 domain-containing protein [Caenorhabditis elegans]|uniref:DUF4294 domain-containing protein n=1 Tax=Caenorhabditis elegans TaxID=6239 RepID=A7LPJ6_CAEEL|nr:DUF4294 domain-containing protein [Caenorhabditis elegans]CAO82027.1 DUF4294 domain-containing protein [Caenorhabditis elegans]|eukprot:NP_001122907.1 Uncharacterized protein CELE_F11A5.17 [Caenorhabditis elegans]